MEAPQRILLSATLHWPLAARIAIAFANLGCHVEAICPRNNPLVVTRAVRKSYAYSVARPLGALHTALRRAQPDLIVPCDDPAAVDLHHLYESLSKTDAAAQAQRSAIERSLGNPAACSLATTRAPFLALAAQVGIRVPRTNIVANAGELSAWLVRRGFPAVIKVDHSCGGQGVSVVHNHEEALRAYRRSSLQTSVVRTLQRFLLERDSSALTNWLRPQQTVISVQDFIPGTPANRAVACWRGEVLAGISVEAIRTLHSTGPATVVRIRQIPEMSEAAQRLVQHLKLSGLWGLDFILEAKTGSAYLIEMNPRATPICHLSLGTEQDLTRALYARLTNSSAPNSTPAPAPHEIIALFPGEWHRNAASPYLRSAYHDVPWEEPALVRDGVERPWSERGFLARLRAQLRSKPPGFAPYSKVDPIEFGGARDKYVR